MRALQPLDTRGDLVLAPLSPDTRLREMLAWAAVVLLPLAALFLFAAFPFLNPQFANHWFHFQIVSLISFVALVLGVSTIALTNAVNDARAFFILVALG